MRAILAILGIFLSTANPVAIATAQDLDFFRIGTGGVAGTYYPIGGVIAHAISNPPGSRPCDAGGSCGPPGLLVIAQSANGSVANVRDIQHGALESGFVQSDIAFWAYTGSGTFRGRPPFRNLRTIANLYPESVHIVVRRESDIRSVRDLVGKRVSLDEPGSGTLIDAELVLGMYGIAIDDIDAAYMKPGVAIERIRRNQLDAFFFVAGYPARAVSELAADAQVRLLPIDGAAAERLTARYRFFARDHIPEGVYPGIPRIATISVGAQWLVSAAVDPELVYAITRALWNHNSRRLLDNGHAKGQAIRLETALDGIAVPLHSGAQRYYREIGMLDD